MPASFTHLPLASLLAFAASASAFAQIPVQTLKTAPLQQSPQPDSADARHITLDVVVAPKSAPPVSGLQQSDFTVLDNKVAQTITNFRAISGSQRPIELILLIDAVNTNFNRIAYERQQVDNFLRANGGHLAYPTSLAIFTDTATSVQPEPSTDGNALAAQFDQADIGLRDIRRTAGFWGADDRVSLSLRALQALVDKEAPRPGRKIILWISPGWPYISGPNVVLDNKQQQSLFAQIMSISTTLRRAGITIYSVDPLGTGEDTGYEFYYETFLKGVSKPTQVLPGDLALQVLAVQSGGRALTASNDIAGELRNAITDLSAYYEISFDAPPNDRPDQYHQLEVRIDKPGLAVRTRTGYYSQP